MPQSFTQCVFPECDATAITRTQNLCRKHHDAVKNYKSYVKKRAWLDEYKLARGCTDCGYNGFPEALGLDHLPGSEKLFNIGQVMMSKTLEQIELEAAKCEVVCANCHQIRSKIRGAGKGPWGEVDAFLLTVAG